MDSTVPSESIHTPRPSEHFVVLQPEFKYCQSGIIFSEMFTN